ncbi:toprim domain-containing protein [Streptomyces scabiei]|uniref:toprim domain-containing protein n=1 Tax=Streptomyces scabiei TaxID=1930 RepID=UPI0033D6F2BE
MPVAPGQGPENYDEERHIAALMDVADRAFRYADEAADGAQRAASRSSTRNEERLESVMFAAHAHWLDAERHHGGAREAHADGQKSRLEYHVTEVISAAVETQRAAGVATTADALKGVLEGLKPATERARLAEARAQLEAELDELKAEKDRQLTAVTRMDAANRERLQRVRWRAESAVPELGWWPTLAQDMAHAYQGRLWLDEAGAPRLLKKTADSGGVVAGRRVNADRVAMLRAAGFLVTGTDSETSTLLHPSAMGREALYLATLYPEGLHADARIAYEARYQASRRPWMNSEERKSAARRLPPLDRHAMRAVREKPVLLVDDQVPQISREVVARHADMAELAQRFGHWAAMSRGETVDAIRAPGTAGTQEPEALAGEAGPEDVGEDELAPAAPSSELPPPGQNAPLAGTTSATTTPAEASEGTPPTAHAGPRAENSPLAPDETPAQPLNQESSDAAAEPEGWSADAPSALAEASSVASGDDEVPAALPVSPGSQERPAPEPAIAPAAQAPPAPGESVPATGPAPAESGEEAETQVTDFEARWRERLAQNAAAGEVLGIDPSAGESFEGYAGRFDGDYDITLPSGRYCYRTPGFNRSKYSVRYIPDPTRAWESKQIGRVSDEADIMPMVRRHAARHADQGDLLAVELNEHEQKALDDVARGIISRFLGEWYRHNPEGRGNAPTYDWTTHALWTLSALGLIQVPHARPDHPDDRFARLSQLGEQRWNGLHGKPLTDTVQPDIQGQTALFAAPDFASTSAPAGQASETVEASPSMGETDTALPRYSRERHQALAAIARGTISVVDGVIMQTSPRRPTKRAPSQKYFRDVLTEGLAEDAGGQIRLSERGFTWYTHHNLTLPEVPRDIETVDQAPLPPIDYASLGVLPVPAVDGEGPWPSAPAPLAADWHRRGGRGSEESVEATYAMADAAAERAARSTARDVADIAAGPDHAYWTHQHPLAQYDENAAAALEAVTDPVTHGYATRAVLQLRAALEEAGKTATDHYVQNVRSPQWKTNQGVQADDVHRDRVRGIVITYLLAVRDHAEEHGLDAETIVNVLEDAAGWAGELRRLGLKEVEYPHLPAAENVAEAAQHVANQLRAYALGETDTVDTVADRRTTWRTVEPRPVPAAPTAAEGLEQDGADVTLADRQVPPEPTPVPSDQVNPSATPAVTAPAQVEEGTSLGQSAAGFGAPDADAFAEATPPTSDGSSVEEETSAPTAADDRNRALQADRQDQAAQAQPGTDGQPLEQPTQLRTDEDGPTAPVASASTVLIEAEAAPAQPTPEGPATPMATPAEITPAAPGPVPDDSAQANGPGASVLATETTPVSTGTDNESDTEPDAPTEVAAAARGDRQQSATPESEIRPQPRPSVAHEEGTVATSAPPSAAPAEEPAAPNQISSQTSQFAPDAAAPYPDPAAYAAAHEALLTQLDQHEQWLALTPAAAEAATTLADTGGLGIPGLTALLALQAALGEGTDEDGQRAHLAQRLGHHILRGQMTMAKIFFARAARTSSTDLLRELYERAAEGQFLAFGEQTEGGWLELGQYLPIRVRQLTQQSDGAEDPDEPTPQTAQEAATMAVDPDDDIQLPVLEIVGEVPHLTAEEAAPRLLAHAQTHLAGGRLAVEQFAHIHGRPVYAMVSQGETPTLYLGLTPPDTDGDTRPVSISGDELATVTAETLLTAVTGWLNGSDTGKRPLLDYASGTKPTPTPDPTEQEHPAPAPAAVPAEPTMANSTVAKPSRAQVPAPEAPAEGPEAEATPATMPPAPEPPPAQPSEQEVRAKPPAPAAATSAPADSSPNTEAHEEARAEDTSQETIAAPAADPNAAAQGDPVTQITALVRTALSDGGVTLDATGVLTAPGTVTITLETSGTPERDREVAGMLRIALNDALRQHPEQQLAAYRVDFEHTSQAGQGSLPESASTTVAPVPRDRLIAANNAAAKIFAERLHSDPNAELTRTYLTQERQLPADVQQEWGLGYAPSDRAANPKRWDILCQELTAQGFTEDELLQAGLTRRSSRGTLIDYFDDRIMFPIHNEDGDIVGFSGRRIDRPGETEEQAKKRQNQKYYNTSNDAVLFSKGDLVFGLHHPAQAESLAGSNGPRVSVEGYLDVIAVARAGATLPLDQRPVVGAPMGTAFTERQLTVLRGLDTDNPRPHIAFLDADESGRKVLLDKWDLLDRAAGPTAVTTAPDAKDAAKLWEDGIEADGDGATPVLRALEQSQPLLDAIVEAVLIKNADETERANHAFDSATFFQRTQAIAAEAAYYIHQTVGSDYLHQRGEAHSLGHKAALEAAALTWAKRLHREWSIPGHMTATSVLLGPGNHSVDYRNEVYEQALDLLAADPEGYFADDSHVRSRQSAAEERAVSAPAPPDGTESKALRRPGQWPAGTRASGPVIATSTADAPTPARGELALSLVLPSSVDGQPVEHTDRTTAAYALHTAVHERLGHHATETPEPDRLPQPLKLGTVHGIDLSTSGDDQTSEDPTVVVWLGPSRSDSLRLSYSRFVEMTGPELLAAVEWRAAQTAGLLGTPLSQTWRDAVRSILPPQFPAQPTPAQLADLLNTIAQAPDGEDERIRRRAEQAVALYTAGHPDLALDHLAANDHIWVLRNDGSWIQEDAPGHELSWEELDNGFSQEAPELDDITQAAAELPAGDPAPMPADLTVAHHSAHEALAVLRPYSIGLPNTLYEKISDLVAQMDAGEPALRRLHGPDGEQLMNRAKRCFVRVLEGLATVASKIRLTGLSTRLERTVARLRGQDPDTLPGPRAVRMDRRMQDLSHIERDLERRMAAPTTTLDERGELQEQWIINRARWRARYEQLNGQPPGADFLPDNGLIAGAPPVPNLVAAHDLLVDRLDRRVAELRDTDPHTGEESNPYDPTADLFNGVAWAYQQRLIGTVPIGEDPQGPIPAAQLRQAALTVTARQSASPLTLRRTMNVTAERADRLLHRLEEQQILGPYRADAPRTVLARPTDIDALLATPPGQRTPPAAPSPTQTPSQGPAPETSDLEGGETDELDTARIHKVVSRILADRDKRSETRSGADPADRAPAARPGKTAHKEAEANALAAGQSTSLAPSQS